MATWLNVYNRIEASSAAFRATNTQNRLSGPSTSITTVSNLANVVANGHFNFVFPSEDRDTLRLVHGIRVVCVDNDPAQPVDIRRRIREPNLGLNGPSTRQRCNSTIQSVTGRTPEMPIVGRLPRSVQSGGVRERPRYRRVPRRRRCMTQPSLPRISHSTVHHWIQTDVLCSTTGTKHYQLDPT